MFFFFNDTATTEIYTLSLHDALPISLYYLNTLRQGVCQRRGLRSSGAPYIPNLEPEAWVVREDRKSTRLNSSHSQISYAVFCLKKKTKSLYLSLLAETMP